MTYQNSAATFCRSDPVRQFRGGGGGGARMESQPFEDSDLEAIRNQIRSLAAVAPVSSSMIQIIYGNENMITSVTGAQTII
jgi:hypothetical protein